MVFEGTDVTLVAHSRMVGFALQAAERLAAEGISAEVIDVATLRPLDFDTIAESVSRTGRCVIVHEAPKTAGFGAEINTFKLDYAFTPYGELGNAQRLTLTMGF